MNSKTQSEEHAVFFRKRKCSTAFIFLLLSVALAFALLSVSVQGDERSGKQVVDMICAECHSTGVNGAPKIGDRQAWSNLVSQGLSNLTLHALQGIRKMPAHGNHPELSDLEISRAISYMVNRSGGNWVEPTSVEELASERSGEQVVKTLCINCHGEGLDGAPKIGDLEAWVRRLKRGTEHALHSAIRGHGGMPARGGQYYLTDNELRSAILYMFYPAAATAKPSGATSSPNQGASMNPNYRTTGGIGIYLGYIPAQRLQSLPKGSPERTMHGGIPKGSGYYHVNVSLYDTKRQAPIKDAHVQMQFERPGLSSDSIELEPMAVGEGSYGNYVKPQPGTSYRLTIHISKPGAFRPVDVKFEDKFFD